ncbi:MAG TPA: DUF255 domain-containing protein [Parasegetibacter sp.]
MYSIKKTGKAAFVAVMTLISVSGFSQGNVQFRDMNFDEAAQLAKETGKAVFVDVHGKTPNSFSLKVEEDVFTVDSIADFMNEYFINIRVNMHEEEGKKFAPHLMMLMYPVYVMFDGNKTQLGYVSASSVANSPGDFMNLLKSMYAQAVERAKNKRSIQFDSDSWNSILAKAKKENKLIFLDAYTEWCRPCLLMAKNVFTLDTVADFYNKNFINVSMDMEKGDGPELAKKYGIKAYPDFIFVDGNGNAVFRGSGYMEAEKFITLGENALKAQKNN